LALLFIAGALAAAVNAFAGGGTLVSFPVLIGLGVGELQANATNSVALWPGSLSSAVGYRDHLGKFKDRLTALIGPTLAGAVTGSMLLVATPPGLFRAVVPWLILSATLLLAFQPQVRAWVAGTKHGQSPALGLLLQFAISVYGGYFGAGMGIMMLAAMALYLDADIHQMNAVKNWLAVVINVVAMGIFVWKGLVLWIPCLSLAAGAVVGGFASARVSQRVPAERLRRLVVVYGLVMAGVFFWRLAQQ
jgi:uncharacterized membrane protein YfcA